MTPIYAEISPLVQPSITLNQLPYAPIHDAQIMNGSLYLSVEDLAALTYGTYESTDSGEKLTIQNQQITYVMNEYAVYISGIRKSIHNVPTALNGVTYLPIEVLDLISYPYTLSEDQLNLQVIPLLPYSTAIDQPTSHHLFKTTYKDFSEVLGNIMDEASFSNLISTAKTNNCYISLMNATYKDKCFEELTQIIKNDKRQVSVHLRQLDCSKKTPVLSRLITLPINYKMKTDGLQITMGDKTTTHSLFWSTYYPFQEDPLMIDLEKSLDVMVMRNIYAYYREQYDLKDDLNTSPIITVQTGRSEQMRYHVYLEQAIEHTDYQVVIYRMTTGSTIQYYIDLLRT